MSGAEQLRTETQAFKRERILQAAMALFYERGYVATTLDDVAAALGVTKPFIYTYFRGKTDLLAALCTPTIELSLQAVAEASAGPGSPTARLRRAMMDFTRVILGRQANIAIFFREEKSLEPAALEEITTLRKRFDRVLSALLAEGVAAGEFDIPDVSLAALAIGGMVSWSYTWHRPNGRLPLDVLCERMAELALRMAGVGIAPPAGSSPFG
ncbi:MAG TPA: TetR/AcrR family transcriptional regulator [Acetobacteraceae bacterium]|nr:TetR/AcrR family transcriptional regulator [Acetobacteraceae bacterium]